jgi:hypothetical protein
VAERVGAHRAAVFALSGLFNVLYWQGVADEIGGADRVWQAVAAHAPAA